jgi:hypothetical protein
MSTFYTSRSNADILSDDETYSTIDLYLSSDKGAIPLAGYNNINAGFTCLLANPIILDISHRYVIALIKKSFCTASYTTRYVTFDFFCDVIEYQYDHNQKSQLLYEGYDHKYVVGAGALTAEGNPSIGDIQNVAWKFINPTQKIIDRISFWVLDENGIPLQTPIAPSNDLYPTKLNVLIKKVNSHVVAVTQL